MERMQYTVIAGAPGSLIVEPPDPEDIRVAFSERMSQEDGKGWIVFAPGVQEVPRFFKERSALKALAKLEDQ